MDKFYEVWENPYPAYGKIGEMKWAPRKQSGFTIVELLIVIVIIAILAAITIVAYNGIQDRAKATSVQSAASQAAKRVMQFYIERADTYPANQAAFDALVSSGGSASYQYSANNSANPKTFCITATVQNLSYYISSTVTSPTVGSCQGHGTNGAPVITNMFANGSFETNTSGWATSGSSIALSTLPAGVASGSQAVEVTTTNTTGTGDIRISGGSASIMPLGLQAGGTYTMSARVHYPAPITGGFNRAPGVLVWYSTNGTDWGTEFFGPKAPAAAGTYTVSQTFTLPSNTVGVLLGLGVASSTASQKVYYDAIMLTEGSTLYKYADGSTPGWVWNGTPFLSTSYGSGSQ